MTQRELVERLIASRAPLPRAASAGVSPRKSEAEGGCGVVGVACSEPIAGRHLLRPLTQMRNRGNGKGGGIAAVGLVPEDVGVAREILERDYLVAVAYLDPAARPVVERNHIEPVFEIDHTRRMPTANALPGGHRLEVAPPEVHLYFARVKPRVVEEFQSGSGLTPAAGLSREKIEDEIVYQNSYRLNHAFYASGEKRAFVLSHGKNMLVLKMVGYGDDVVRHYKLEDVRAHVWIGHHRYPTKGRVWHPGGAHPFVGLHEALVHNGDFANYASICEYLAQRNIRPLFLTDTEVSVLVFDLLHRTYGYPLEYVIESLAPTTERDFALLPEEKRRIYGMLQAVHIHGSPDGPWFFLIAQSVPGERAVRLIGITDTSMLRPQVFALQRGEVSIGLSASEKQAIDAVLESLAREDARFWTRADRYWNARGGSHTDGGAFIFEVRPGDGAGRSAALTCTDKFGRHVTVPDGKPARVPLAVTAGGNVPAGVRARRPHYEIPPVPAEDVFRYVVERLPSWDYGDARSFLAELVESARDDGGRARAIEVLTLLIDRRYATGSLRRSRLLSLFDETLSAIVESIRRSPTGTFVYVSADGPRPMPLGDGQTVVLDARGFASEGESSLALEIVRLYRYGFRRFLVVHTKGHRFIANGLGAKNRGLRIDVYGSSGDYLASGIDGVQVVVHGTAQDQVAQIMKDGSLVIFGDVGQTFMYAAKGGKAFVLGNAAGRPLINAVGSPRVVINGTCLDYLAESFMAGDPLKGGGFVILNGITLDDDGRIVDLETPYPGGNLFSLASGGAIYVRDPHRKLSDDQLNGGEFAELETREWTLIKPYLEENERLFGIPLDRLLEVQGKRLRPGQVYRKIRPGRVRALEPEEAWHAGT